jgi:hypothetical protein
MGFRLTDRDINIIRYVERFRLLRSRSHILPLFGGSKHLLRRLKKLYKNKYLYRLPDRDPYEEAVYAIGNTGADLLNTEFDLPRPNVDYTQQSRTLGLRFIEHTLLVADIITAVILACRSRENIRYISQEKILSEWAPEKTRKQRFKVGGRPFRWKVKFTYDSRSFRKSIEPDHMFGLQLRDGRNEFFFLEADRQNMPVKSRNMDRSSIFKKQLQYWESWQMAPFAETNLYEKHFGISDVRTIFAISTGYRGDKRLNRCIEVNKHFRDGSGTGLFVFANTETLLEADDILTAPLTSGRGAKKTFME